MKLEWNSLIGQLSIKYTIVTSDLIFIETIFCELSKNIKNEWECKGLTKMEIIQFEFFHISNHTYSHINAIPQNLLFTEDTKLSKTH